MFSPAKRLEECAVNQQRPRQHRKFLSLLGARCTVQYFVMMRTLRTAWTISFGGCFQLLAFPLVEKVDYAVFAT